MPKSWLLQISGVVHFCGGDSVNNGDGVAVADCYLFNEANWAWEPAARNLSEPRTAFAHVDFGPEKVIILGGGKISQW